MLAMSTGGQRGRCSGGSPPLGLPSSVTSLCCCCCCDHNKLLQKEQQQQQQQQTSPTATALYCAAAAAARAATAQNQNLDITCGQGTCTVRNNDKFSDSVHCVVSGDQVCNRGSSSSPASSSLWCSGSCKDSSVFNSFNYWRSSLPDVEAEIAGLLHVSGALQHSPDENGNTHSLTNNLGHGYKSLFQKRRLKDKARRNSLPKLQIETTHESGWSSSDSLSDNSLEEDSHSNRGGNRPPTPGALGYRRHQDTDDDNTSDSDDDDDDSKRPPTPGPKTKLSLAPLAHFGRHCSDDLTADTEGADHPGHTHNLTPSQASYTRLVSAKPFNSPAAALSVDAHHHHHPYVRRNSLPVTALPGYYHHHQPQEQEEQDDAVSNDKNLFTTKEDFLLSLLSPQLNKAGVVCRTRHYAHLAMKP